MNRLFFVILPLLFAAVVYTSSAEESSQSRSESIVFISGQRYYVHKVASGETLYSLSKLYGVLSSDIEDSNLSVKESGLKQGENIKIPVTESLREDKKVVLSKKQRRSFDTHTVMKGQTLYAISRMYEISVATIVEDNPKIDPSHLALGQKILIRKKSMGRSSESEAMEEIAEYTTQMNRVAPKGYEYYAIPPKETLYSLLRRTEMSRTEFYEVNPSHMGELRAGEIILIRTKGGAEEQTESDGEEQYVVGQQPIHLSALRRGEPLDVALLLPLSMQSGAVISPMAEFYQGFLLGVEELKERGMSVNVNLFDTKRNSAEVEDITSSEAFRRSKLIVGPVYEDMLSEVLPYAERKAIPVVSPLATLKESNSGVLFQMAPMAEHRYDKIGDMLADSTTITLIYTANNDAQYEAQVKELLNGRDYTIHTYEYEHPSVIADRVREAKRLGVEDELEPSPSDLSPLIEGEGRNTIFILSDNETDVDRVLSALVSAEISLRSRSQRVSDFSVVNNPQWNRYTNIDRAMMFRACLTAFSSYHATRDSQVIKEYDSRYVEAFGTLPSLYSYRGYDVAMIFCEGMYSDIEYGMEGRTFKPLQTTYRFQRGQGTLSRANQNWIKVNYLSNFTITLE